MAQNNEGEKKETKETVLEKIEKVEDKMEEYYEEILKLQTSINQNIQENKIVSADNQLNRFNKYLDHLKQLNEKLPSLRDKLKSFQLTQSLRKKATLLAEGNNVDEILKKLTNLADELKEKVNKKKEVSKDKIDEELDNLEKELKDEDLLDDDETK